MTTHYKLPIILMCMKDCEFHYFKKGEVYEFVESKKYPGSYKDVNVNNDPGWEPSFIEDKGYFLIAEWQDIIERGN